MEKVINIKKDLDRVNKLLSELKPNVTAADRKEAPASELTVIQYLNGEGKDLAKGMELLRFFNAKVEERRSLLTALEDKANTVFQ